MRCHGQRSTPAKSFAVSSWCGYLRWFREKDGAAPSHEQNREYAKTHLRAESLYQKHSTTAWPPVAKSEAMHRGAVPPVSTVVCIVERIGGFVSDAGLVKCGKHVRTLPSRYSTSPETTPLPPLQPPTPPPATTPLRPLGVTGRLGHMGKRQTPNDIILKRAVNLTPVSTSGY